MGYESIIPFSRRTNIKKRSGMGINIFNTKKGIEFQYSDYRNIIFL